MDRSDRRLLIWWAILVALTLLSFESAWAAGWMRHPSAAIFVIIGVALLKVRIVVMEFMEVGDASWILRAPFEAWVLAIGAGLLTLWLSAGA